MTKPGTISLTPVILCGGVGSRLWPLSRAHVPKQFMALASDRALLQDTAIRVANPDSYRPPIIVCGEDHRFLAAEQLRQIGVKPAALILEPIGRGTAPAIALAALKCLQSGDASVIVVMPSDHLICLDENFHAAIAIAAEVARSGRIATLGIKPDAPVTGYGYITGGRRIEELTDCFEIEQFIEKPEIEVATALIEHGHSYWNAGIFVGHPEMFLSQLEERNPDIVEVCREAIANGEDDLDFYRPRPDRFRHLPAISIDHAIMEHTTIGAVVPVEMGWSDVGSWSALWELIEKDAIGNAVRGPVHHLETKGCYLRSEGPLLATVGVEDLIVVADSDAVLVAGRDQAQRVKDMFETLRSKNKSVVESHRTVYRPWGSYESVVAGDGFQVKRIIVKPSARLSLQKHRYRAEHWVVVHGTALVTRGTETFRLSANQSTYIPVGEIHRLENDSTEPLHLIEVQSGSYLGEDDIVRLDDSYGRMKNTAAVEPSR